MYPVLHNLDHIWQSQQTLGNARKKILTLLKTGQIMGTLVKNLKAIAQETTCADP